MEKLKIDLCLLGRAKFEIDQKSLMNHNSKVFSISDIRCISTLPECDLPDKWGYSDSIFTKIFQPSTNSAFSIGIVDAPLEKNYYMRRILDNQCVISLFEMKEIIQTSHVSLEKYILRNIYELLLIYHRYNNRIINSIYTVAHSDIRKCLFDMSGHKTDIAYSMTKPIICEECTTVLNKSGVDNNIVEQVRKEIKKININRTTRFIIFVKNHLIFSLIISSVWALLLSVIASAITIALFKN